MSNKPTISICVPIHDMENGAFFLWRLVNSLTEQTFKDWELIITKDGRMAENTNSAIKQSHGEFIKILYLDDYFSHSNSLMHMVKAIDRGYDWLISGSNNNLDPKLTYDIQTGNNKLGSPSALMFRDFGEDNLLFDENMSWLLDCDLYKRMFDAYGSPVIIPGDYVTIGTGPHQMTSKLTDKEKLEESIYLNKKYV